MKFCFSFNSLCIAGNRHFFFCICTYATLYCWVSLFPDYTEVNILFFVDGTQKECYVSYIRYDEKHPLSMLSCMHALCTVQFDVNGFLFISFICFKSDVLRVFFNTVANCNQLSFLRLFCALLHLTLPYQFHHIID